MDGFKNIDIKNFRGIEHLKIDDFARVNVFLGQNNSGKSSVLEALMLLMGMSNPDMPQQLNYLRTNVFNPFRNISYLFHNMDINNAPVIMSEQFDALRRLLELKLTYVFDGSQSSPEVNGQSATSETKTFLNTLEMNFAIELGGEKKHYRSSVTINQTTGMIANRTVAEGYLEKNSASFLSASLNSSRLVEDLSELIKRKRKNVILERMQMFDFRINAIEVIANDVFIGFEGVAELMPIGMTGDGLRRYLSVVASTANTVNNIILIDEIDNGLHYSAYKKLWESIFILASETNKQVFITTHSKETLMKLHEMLEENSEYQKMFRLYTIEKTLLKGHKAYKYGYEGLASACMNDVELRSILENER